MPLTPLKDMYTSKSLELMKVALFGIRALQVFKLWISVSDHPALFEWALNPMTHNLIRDTRGKVRTTDDKAMWRRRQRLELCSHKPRTKWIYQELVEARKDSPLEPAEIEWPWYFNSRLLISRTMKKYISVVLIYHVCSK